MSESIFALLANHAPSPPKVNVAKASAPEDGDSSFEGILSRQAMSLSNGEMVEEQDCKAQAEEATTRVEETQAVETSETTGTPEAADEMQPAAEAPAVDATEAPVDATLAAALMVQLPAEAPAEVTEATLPEVVTEATLPEVEVPEVRLTPTAQPIVTAETQPLPADGTPVEAVPEVQSQPVGEPIALQVSVETPAAEVVPEEVPVEEMAAGRTPEKAETPDPVPPQTSETPMTEGPPVQTQATVVPEVETPKASTPEAPEVSRLVGTVSETTPGREESTDDGDADEQPDASTQHGVAVAAAQAPAEAEARAEVVAPQPQSFDRPESASQGEDKGHVEPTTGVMQFERTAASEAVEKPATEPLVDPSRFVDRVVRVVHTVVANGSSSIEMRLNPPELGTVRVEMTIREGELRMTMSTSTEEARQVIASHLGGLRSTLVQQGYEVGRLDVSVSSDAANGQAAGSHADARDVPHRGPRSYAQADEAETAGVARATHYASRYLDMVA